MSVISTIWLVLSLFLPDVAKLTQLGPNMPKKCLYLTEFFSVFTNPFLPVQKLICIKVVSKFDWRSWIFNFLNFEMVKKIDILVKNAKIWSNLAIFLQVPPIFSFRIVWIFLFDLGIAGQKISDSSCHY